ncbi:glycosyltransferase [Variovorax sp. LjRoot178]
MVIGEADTDSAQIQIFNHSNEFDIILDDRSQQINDTASTFSRYFPSLAAGGLYVVHDIYSDDLGARDGAMASSRSIEFFRQLADIIFAEQRRPKGSRTEQLKLLAETSGCELSDAELTNICSVEFRGAAILVHKRRLVDSSSTASTRSRDIYVKQMDNPQPFAPNESSKQIDMISARIADLRNELEWSRNQLERTRAASLSKEFALNARIRTLQAQAFQDRNRANHFEQVVEATKNSTSWKITTPIRRLSAWLQRQRNRSAVLWRAAQPNGTRDRRQLKAAITRRIRPGSYVADPSDHPESYLHWVEKFDILNAADHALIKAHAEAVQIAELQVVWLLPADDSSAVHTAASSLLRQICGNWRAILVSANPGGQSRALAQLIRTDSRFSLKSRLSSEELTQLRDKHCLVLNGPGELADHATYMFGLDALNSYSAVYCDEDLGPAHERKAPRFAPAYSPEYAAVGTLALLHGSEDMLAALTTGEIDLGKMLSTASTESSLPPRHLPFVLFHAKAEPILLPPTQRSYLEGDVELPTVAIIIPTKNRLDFLEPCITSIEKSDYPRDRYKIVVVDNGSNEPDILKYLDEMERLERITVFRDPQKFNYSRLNNLAASNTQSDLIAFLNNDIVIIDPLWLRRLAFQAVQPGVGAVGGKLLYPDRTVQHGGIILGIQGVAAHAHHGLDAGAPGYLGLASATHGISAVTGACLVLKRSRFEEIGGFDQELAVAFNDVLLCMDLAQRGYRNVYVGHPLMLHFESKTRGFDDTAAKQQLFRAEARYARRKDQALFKNDPFYNSNLSLERAYDFAFPPRVSKPWNRFRSESIGKLRILMLSVTHQIGHGVPVVVDLQARHLASVGHEVFIGGPVSTNEFSYPGCIRVELNAPKEAAIFAVQHGIDCVVMHTPPFYSTTRWLGAGVKTLAYDYGEPNPDFFPDAEERKQQLQEKDFCLEMADALYAISDAVKAEAPHERMGVIPLGNAHLARWEESSMARRAAKREELGFGDRIVVLNVCRFHEGERYYKGVDEYCHVKAMLDALYSDRSNPFMFVLAGKGTQADVEEMEASGLKVFANISDEELIDLYCCADLYANFSRWEGYNFGIGQALALGLPVVASEIPAHRAFGVFVSNDASSAARELVSLSEDSQRQRIAKVTEWAEPLRMFSEAIEQLNHGPSKQLK